MDLNFPAPVQNPDLSVPSSAWLGRLLGFRDLREAVVNGEGPRIFAPVTSLDELRDVLGTDTNAEISVLSFARTELPGFLRGLPRLELAPDVGAWQGRVASWGPPPPESVLLIYLQNPLALDGTTLHVELLVSLLDLLEPLQKNWARVIFISDETQGAFSWDVADDPAQIARLPPSLLSRWEFFVAFRPATLLGWSVGGENSLLLWTVPKSRAACKGSRPQIASPVAWKLLQRDLNQSIELVRFRHLALRNLKTLGLGLTSLVQSEKVSVGHWPLSGFYVTLALKNRGHEDPALLARRLEHHGVRAYPHPLASGQIVICYILDNAVLRKGLERLVKAVELF